MTQTTTTTTPATYADVRAYMMHVMFEHLDVETDEICRTGLAEDACDHFNGYDPEDGIPEWYFELADSVVSDWEHDDDPDDDDEDWDEDDEDEDDEDEDDEDCASLPDWWRDQFIPDI